MDIQHTVPKDPNGRRSCTAKAGLSCGRGCRKNPRPELAPTFDCGGRRIERIVPPGEGLATENGNSGVRTCDCDACKALYAELTGTELVGAEQ
jgi:hypothetical protein